jgi:hypothetical protein
MHERMRSLGLAMVTALVLATAARAQTTSTTTSTTTTTLPFCGFTASVAVWVVNETDQPSVQITVDGALAAGAVTCGGGAAFHETYSQPMTCTGTGLVSCGTITGLRPGAWVHRITVQAPATGQQQARGGVVIAPSAARSVANPVVWTVYGFTRALTTTSASALRQAVKEAAAYTAANPTRHALITLRPPGPIVLDGQFCPSDAGCTPVLNSPKAGLCLHGDPTASGGPILPADRIVIDGRGTDGVRAAELKAAGADPLVRVYGSDVELRGLVLTGSTTASSAQADTVDFQSTAERSALVDCLVRGPSKGDAVGAQCKAGGGALPDASSLANANLVVDSEIRDAKDKGVKVSDGAWQIVASSCVHDNKNGGIQATLGGNAVARENVVQHNVPNQAENGIFANGTTDLGNTGRSSVTTRGNIVRFSGNRGLSVIDNAQGDFHDDYVARNQYAGARVEASLVGAAPAASFSGVATVCNQMNTVLSGSCDNDGTPCLDATDCTGGGQCKNSASDGLGFSIGFALASACVCSAAPCPCSAPGVSLAAGASNATNVNNKVTGAGANLDFEVPGATLAAGGTQWQGCVDATCGDANAVQAQNVRTDPTATVTMTPLLPSGTATPTLSEVSPMRPRAGEIVHVYGTGFDAITGTALNTACHTPPARNADFCDPSDDDLAQKNRSGTNRLKLVRPVGSNGSVTTTLDLVAVTPTMLAFRMPGDCYGPAKLQIGSQPPDLAICDPDGCAGQPAGVACADDDGSCTTDVCDGAGTCVRTPLSAGTVCRPTSNLCEAPGQCDGATGTCPELTKRPNGYVCRPAAGGCDLAETCDGTSKSCPTDAKQPANSVCRAAVGSCDVVEKCDGTSAACPADVVQPASKTCRPALPGGCDVAESCTGTSGVCPPDVVVAAGVECRAAQGECDLAESCTGSSNACPADAKRTDVCRAAVGACDAAERCDGVADTCPADALQPAGAVCRAAADACDAAETCDGTSTACPPDRLRPAGGSCRAAADACDVVETCDGTTAACPADAHAGGFDAVGCVLGQLDGAARLGCEPRVRVLAKQLQRATDALARARAACDVAKVPVARRQLQRVRAALGRVRRAVVTDACLRDTSPTWTGAVATASARARDLRASLATLCRP